MSRQHALLSPSGAAKWLNCTPSARLEAQFDDVEGEAAREGTLAHSLAELIIHMRRGDISGKVYREQMAVIQESKYYNKAMYEYCDDYAVYVLQQFSEAQTRSKDAKLFIEQTFDISRYAPDCFGHVDCTIIADGIMEIIDFKFGKGVSVDAANNPQLCLYALGALEEYAHLYDIHTVRMTIQQPRLNNISTFSATVGELETWAYWVRPVAYAAFEGKGEFRPGSHCKFCKAKTVCKANAEFQLSVVKADFVAITNDIKPSLPEAHTLNEQQITFILKYGDEFKTWVKSVEEYALAQALGGKAWDGYKLVSGRSVRKITDLPAVEKLLIKEGYDRTKLYKPQELISMTEIEKMTGKKFFDANISPFTTKTEGAPTLMPVTDKRPAYNKADDFEVLE